MGAADEQYLALEPDPKHATALFKLFGLERGKAATTPRVRKTAEQAEADSRTAVLSAQSQTLFRSATLRLAYVGQDRPDLSEAIKHLTTRMSQPRESDLVELKRLVRYLVKSGRTVLRYPWQMEEEQPDTYSDSDWAGCKKTGRSTSGGAVVMGEHYMKG